MLEDQRYILENGQPVACDDETTWQEFMRNPENVLVAQDSAGKYDVLTVFLGFNQGSTEQPAFFQTSVFGMDEHSHGDAATWSEAQSYHAGLLMSANRMAKRQADIKAGIKRRSFTAIDIQVVSNEIHFVLESEEHAIKALPVDKKHWKRRGNVIVFVVSL